MNTQPKSVPVKRAAPNIQLPPQQVVAQPIPVPSAIPQPTVTIEPKSADIDLSLLLGIEVTQKKTVEISTNSIKINDNELERQFSEPSTVAPESISTSPVEPIAISKPLVVDNIQPQLEPYSAEDWKQQIVQWRLNALQLSVAERCVRLRADDPNKILLACPPSEAVSLALMRDKLAQAIHQISPNLQVSWLPTWQDHWQTIQSYAQAASEQERVMAQQQITNHPIFAQLCHSTGLTPSWDGLNKRKTSSN